MASVTPDSSRPTRSRYGMPCCPPRTRLADDVVRHRLLAVVAGGPPAPGRAPRGADAAGVARAVFPATSPSTRPGAVVLADGRDWRVGVAAAVLAGTTVRAPILLSNGSDLPAASADALTALKPTGSKA